MDNSFLGYGGGAFGGTFGMPVNSRGQTKMTEAEKEQIIMSCRDANSNDEIDEILSRVGDDDSWGEISELINRLR